jgi:hypothetical protein
MNQGTSWVLYAKSLYTKKISRYCPFKRCLAANHISFFFIVTFTIKLFACVALPLHTIPVLNFFKSIENCE